MTFGLVPMSLRHSIASLTVLEVLDREVILNLQESVSGCFCHSLLSIFLLQLKV